MKLLKLYIISTVLIFISSCGAAQNNTSEKQVENMLMDFYSKYVYIWENTPINDAVPVNVLYGKLDSLIQKFCTSKLRNKAITTFQEADADWLTNNLVGSLNENLKVEKDTTKEDGYIVSFAATYTDAPGGQTKKQVTLQVTVVKEGESYKIADVK